MNLWIRENHDSIGEDGVRLAEAVRDKLREYAIPVAVLVADSLDEATESFKRVNSSGTPMDTFHMVAALAYTEKFSLPETFERLKADHLGPRGWDDVGDTDILRVCAGLTSTAHPAKLKVEAIARALKGDSTKARNAIAACARAAVESSKSPIIEAPSSCSFITAHRTTIFLIFSGNARNRMDSRSQVPLTADSLVGVMVF